MNRFKIILPVMRGRRGWGNFSLPSVVIAVLLMSCSVLVASIDDEYAYDYGNTDVHYDTIFTDLDPPPPGTLAVKQFGTTVEAKTVIPLCCERGQVYDYSSCITTPSDYNWRPKMDGISEVSLKKRGLPTCSDGKERVDLYQKDILFNANSEALLPYYIYLYPVPPESYCVVKIYDADTPSTETFQTKVFACLDQKENSGLMWTCVGIAHALLLITLITFFVMGELRSLQGQYMICFLISLLIYNLSLYPLSEISMDISDVSCIAIGAIKYFFFCGIFLWFNVMCFDVWRTLSCQQDVSGRRRFLFYSAYSWIIGAILTTVVLVLPYSREGTKQGATNDPLMEDQFETCKLKMEMDMILQLAQLISILLDLIFLVLGTCNMCGYDKLGNGLLRTDASLCLKQAWKMFIIMIAHVISTIDKDIINYPITMWQYILLESTAFFAVFAYRQTIIRWFRMKLVTSRPNIERGSTQEKNVLTM